MTRQLDKQLAQPVKKYKRKIYLGNIALYSMTSMLLCLPLLSYADETSKKLLQTSSNIAANNTAINNIEDALATEITESDVSANSNTATAKTIVVTASGFEQSIKDAPASISVVTREELAKKPFRDITDALRDIPGVTITGGGAGTDISLRGMGSKYTLMLIDGKRQSSRETRPNSDGPGIEQGWIPPLSAIERIEVIRGPMSSLYGSDAMGGVINIITRKVAKEWGGSVRMESTIQEDSASGNSNTVNIYANGPIIADRLGLQLYGAYSGRGEDQFLSGFPKRSLNSFSGKLSFIPITDHTLELEVGTSLQKRIARKGVTSKNGSTHESRRNNESLRHIGDWGFAHSEITLAHEKTNNSTRKMIVENKSMDGNILLPFGQHKLIIGGQYRDEKLDDQGNQYDKSVTELSRFSYAVFVEDEWQITDSFALTGGLRYDYDENYSGHINPRIYAVWNLSEEWTLKGGISTGFTAPGLRYVANDWGQVTGGGQSNGMILGNPDLTPEKSTNYEVSINYENDNQLTASATAFYTVFKDKIQSYYVCDDRTLQNKCIASNGEGFDFIQSRTNVDKAKLKGLEISVKIPLPQDFSINSSYTWTKTEQASGKNKGNPLNRIPDHQLNVSIEWDVNDQVNLWVKTKYNGKEKSIGSGGNISARYPGYSVLDLGGSWKISKENTLYAGVYNVSNKEIRSTNVGRLDDGRRYWLGLNVDF